MSGAPTLPDRGADRAAPPEAAPLVLLAGGGRFPFLVARAVEARGRRVAIAALKGEADAGLETFPHIWIGRGQLGALMRLIRREGARDLCIIGGVRNRRMPGLSEIDLGGLLEVIRNWRILTLGDDSLLRKLARGFETRGLRVVGAAEVAPELVMPAGPLGAVTPTECDWVDIGCGVAAARAHGRRDLGQAVIAAGGAVVVKEGPAGTDAMMAAHAAMRTDATTRCGVLVKCLKPTQDRRLDMPAIGPDTVRVAAASGLRGIAVEAGATLVADRDEVARLADAAGLFVVGVGPRGGEETAA